MDACSAPTLDSWWTEPERLVGLRGGLREDSYKPGLCRISEEHTFNETQGLPSLDEIILSEMTKEHIPSSTEGGNLSRSRTKSATHTCRRKGLLDESLLCHRPYLPQVTITPKPKGNECPSKNRKENKIIDDVGPRGFQYFGCGLGIGVRHLLRTSHAAPVGQSNMGLGLRGGLSGFASGSRPFSRLTPLDRMVVAASDKTPEGYHKGSEKRMERVQQWVTEYREAEEQSAAGRGQEETQDALGEEQEETQSAPGVEQQETEQSSEEQEPRDNDRERSRSSWIRGV